MQPPRPSGVPIAAIRVAARTQRASQSQVTVRLYLRDTYPIETARAPQYVSDQLRQVRAAAHDARLAGLRALSAAVALA
jgi:hypothetical protein